MKILIHKADHLGDFVMALPALWEVRQKFGKDANLHLLVRGPNVEWQQFLPWLGTLSPLKHPRYERKQNVPKLSLSARALGEAWGLRDQSFDWGIDLVSTRNDLLGKWLLWVAGCSQTSGPDGAHSWMLNHAQAEPAAHQTKILASRFPAEWGISGTASPAEFVPDELRWDSEGGARRPLVIAPFAGTPAKRWLDASWKELFKHLQSEGPVHILVPKPDLERNRDFLSAYPEESLRIVETIQETLQVLLKARACIALDTAVAHYAWLTGTPFVQLFARTTEPARWAPVSGGITLESHPDLSPSVSEQVLPGYAMDDITVAEVFGALHELEGEV
ncbi:MAG: glycosyltransferase family 9 protein [Verrucomicrobiota bacterium]